jgi:4-hydroxyphenylpyruvate dioxygenase
MQRDSEIATFTLNHGDSVRDVAIRTADCEAFYYETMRRGAQSVLAPTEWADDHGVIRRAAIKTYGDVVHSIVDRSDYNGCFMPGFVPYSDLFPVTKTGEDVGLLTVDHVVGNVEFGEMNTWVKFYEDVLGFNQFKHFSDDDIQTEYTALMSKVMTNGNNKIKFPINEPAQGKRKSQIEEYLDFHNGPGVQHVAMLTGDIVKSVSALRDRGLNFLYVPETYYEELIDRVGKIDEDPKSLEPLGILVDRDDDGYLLQLFTRPVVDKPTLFFEIIQRKGSQGFGLGNFKALFESIEREQERRGNL